MGYLDPRELNDLIALAERGGIGKGVALTDCVAAAPDQLMYISGDELILLRDLGKVLLASCEGIIGWVERENVKFDYLASGSSSSPNTPEKTVKELPKTILTAPSPPRSTSSHHSHRHLSNDNYDVGEELVPRRGELKRISGPFELDSPQPSPSLHSDNDKEGGFFEQQQQSNHTPNTNENGNSKERDSIMSSTSSEAFGGIGGFMMGGSESEDDHGNDKEGMEELKEESPSSPTIITPHSSRLSSVTPTFPTTNHHNHSSLSHSRQDSTTTYEDEDDSQDDDDENENESEFSEDDTTEWDIYDDYARESMYGPAKRISLAIQQKRLSKSIKTKSNRIPSPLRLGENQNGGNSISEYSNFSSSGLNSARSTNSSNNRPSPLSDTFRLPSAIRNRDRENGLLSPSPINENENEDEENETVEVKEEDPELLTPKLERSSTESNQPAFEKVDLPSAQSNGNGRSVATELRLRIMRERAKESEESDKGSSEGHTVESIEQSSSKEVQEDFHGNQDDINQEETLNVPDQQSREEHVSSISQNHQTNPSTSTTSGQHSSNTRHNSEESTDLATPQPEDIVTFNRHTSDTDMNVTKSTSGHSLLASPLPIDGENAFEEKVDINEHGVITAPNLVPPPPHHSPNPNLSSPHLNHAPWKPGSPSSPHSISATRQAVDAARSVSDGKRPRGLTLVGRMEADLLASKGPVPITFLVNGPGMPAFPPSLPNTSQETIGLGLPSSKSRSSSPHESRRTVSPHEQPRRTVSPLASPILPNEDTLNQASPFPPHPHPHVPIRSATSPSPLSPSIPSTPNENELIKPSPTFSGRPRARSFSATVAKTLGVGGGGKKESTPPPPPTLSIKINQTPPIPNINSPLPQSSSSIKKSFFSVGSHGHGSKKSSLLPSLPSTPNSPSGLSRVSALGSSTTLNHLPVPSTPSNNMNNHGYNENNQSTNSLSLGLGLPIPPQSARSSSFSFTSKSSTTPSIHSHTKIPKKVSSSSARVLPSPISHKDFIEETIKAEGLDFELIQPKKQTNNVLLSPIEDNSPISDSGHPGNKPNSIRQSTTTSQNSLSPNSLKPLPETDEWGFLKDKSPVPEIFQSRSQAGDHRVIEQKWLSIISTPLPPNTPPPKKVRKLVLDAGVPSSLRGKVWAWFMAGTLSARTPGLYQELIEHDKGLENERIDKDVAGAYPDHSIFSTSNSAGQQDLRLILRAYSNFAPSGYRSEMALIAGSLVIHCVAEDSFWLLSGLVNSILKDYYVSSNITDKESGKVSGLGLKIDSSVFMNLLTKEDQKLGRLFKDVGLHPISFLDKWFTQLFIRCLPWPTTLRVIDAVVSEGPRFLLIASLAIVTLSRDRLFNLRKDSTAILSYLQNLPQDSLLLPENFMKVCDQIKFDEKDYRKSRAIVEKELLG